MEFNIKVGHPEKQKTACIVIPIYDSKHLSNAAERLDNVSGGYISKVLQQGDLAGKINQTLLLHDVPNIPSDRVLLIGCGKAEELNDIAFKKIVSKAVKVINNTGTTEAIFFVTECNVKERDLPWKIQHAIIAAEAALYSFDAYKSEKKSKPPLRRIIFTVPTRRSLPSAEQALCNGIAIAKGVGYAKDLGNTPANICTPSYLAKEANKLAKKYSPVSVAVLDKKDMQALGMQAILTVAQGSSLPPKLITLEYRGNGKSNNHAPIVLVGKGITFDTGGNSLKPPTSMLGMKYDMCGAASVLGTILFAAEMGLPINLVGVIAAAENMPGGTACRPNDIIKSLSGITIEILNTDAEGRLILCDALSYCERFKPKLVIDVATLTGACVIALGHHYSGLFSNNDTLAKDLIAAGQLSGDKCWQMPLDEEYQSQLDSDFADVANTGGREAGSITAACFLSRFTKKYHWAHLDISGASKITKKGEAATGRPVLLLVQYLLNYLAEQHGKS